MRSLSKRFGGAQVLEDVDLSVSSGQVHALLGPNGAGKTTFLRIMTGLVTADSGTIEVLGRPLDDHGHIGYRRLFGLVPSGDRSFYLRLSGQENLQFFARLHGLGHREAKRRSQEILEAVGLAQAARRPVGLYSHGMQKRLSVARAVLGDPVILYVDEATHDLDPEGAQRVRDLVAQRVAGGCAVLWTTQRLEEVRGFADTVTVLDTGRRVFNGSVPRLLSLAVPTRYILLLDCDPTDEVLAAAGVALGPRATLELSGSDDDRHCVLALGDDVALGDALQALAQGGFRITHCTEERSGLERAFLGLLSERSDGG